MSSPIIPCPFQYTDIPGGGQQAIIIASTTAPTVSQNQQGPGTFWVQPQPQGNGNLYYLSGFLLGVPQWTLLSTSAGSIVSVLGTANQITSTVSTGVATLSIPAAFVAPGSVTATTTLTATLGNITATNGNFVGSTAGTGLQFNANTATGAAPGPVVLNSRAGRVVFTGVSIAAAADLTLTITNSAITGATTQVIYSMAGATTGSALSIKSVTNSAGSSAIVVTNGTGATTTTADIDFNFIVVN